MYDLREDHMRKNVEASGNSANEISLYSWLFLIKHWSLAIFQFPDVALKYAWIVEYPHLVEVNVQGLATASYRFLNNLTLICRNWRAYFLVNAR